MAITSVLKPVVRAALKKFIKDKSTLAGIKKFRKKFNPLTKEGEGGKLTIPQREFIANKIGVDDYKLVSQKTGREKVPQYEKRKGEDYVQQSTRDLLSKRNIENRIKQGLYPMKVGKKTYQMYVDDASKAFRVSNEAAKQSPEVMGAVQLRRAENALYPERNTPWKKLFDRYGYSPEDFRPVVEGRREMQDMFKEMNIYELMDALKILRPGQRAGSIGHTLPLSRLRDISLLNPNIPKKELMKLGTDPGFMQAQPNFFNQALAGIESLFYNPKYANTPFGMQRATKALDEAQLTSRILRPGTMDIETYGRGDKPVDYKLLKEYLEFVLGKKPYGVSKLRKTGEERTRLLPDISFLKKRFNKGGVVEHFQAGGLASLLGKKLLKKIAGKLSEKELKMLMGSLWKGVDPRRSPRYRVWDKKRFGPGYKWPWQKSRIKGPEIKKSHFASLSPGERVELQAKNADELWEYQMKKKLGRDMHEDLEYPFLSPENEAFISTAPRTGLGRYQLQHYVDPENVGPIDKYKVYDWWDDVLNKMRKKPKFKYVKDAKGNIVLRKIK